MRRPFLRLFLVPAALSAFTGGCSVPDNEALIRELIADAEAAAEARDTGFFRRVISEDYVDGAGRRREQVIERIRGYFFINQRIEVLSRIERVELLGAAEDAAEVTVLVAVIGGPRSAAITSLEADLERLELALVREGADWRIIAAGWRGD